MPQDITVSPSNSPYSVPAPSVTYGSVTIQPGGYLVFPQPTTMTCDSLIKSAELAKK